MADTENRYTILVVDDSFTTRALLGKIFEDSYQVEFAEDGYEALRILRQGSGIAAVLLDLHMPKLDGYGVLAQMREDEDLKSIPVVVITASDDVESQLRAFDLGVVDVLIKPFNSQVVLHRVRNVIMRWEAARQAAQNALLEEQLRLSDIDEKTGIYNRRAFCRQTSKMLRDNPGTRYVLVRWDIDRFKVFNDIFGIAAGDRFLAGIGDTYRKLAGPAMVYGHWEADHFVMCMPQDLFTDAQVAEKAKWPMTAESEEYDFSVRMGIYLIEDTTLDVSLMCDRAFLALRSIKNNYTVHVAYYDDSMRAAMIEEQRIVSEMDTALEQGQFVVYLQPQCNYVAGSLHGAEALVRWNHPERGLVPPDEFIPIFEHNGFITKMDECVWEQVCRLQRSWLDKGLPVVPISVNISRRDIYNPHLVDVITDLVARYRLNTSLIRLEITESAYMENAKQLIRVVERLRSAGFAVEMDDFGSGYSSLNTLKEVPVDMLKLDMKFLQGDENNPRGGNILTSIIRMAHWIDLPVLAEGVETRAQAEYLKSVGCSYIQGYFYARPMPASQFEKLLETDTPESVDDKPFYSDALNMENYLSASSQATLLFNSFVGGAAIIESDGENVEALRLNDRFLTEINTTREAYDRVQLHMQDCVVDEDRATFMNAIAKAVATGDESECALRLKPAGDAEGSGVIYTQNRLRVLARSSNRDILYLSTENTTLRMQALARNVELSDRLEGIMDNVPCGISDIRIADHLELVYFNSNMASMFGFSRTEYERRFANGLAASVHPDDMQEVMGKIAEFSEGKIPRLVVDYRHICADGNWRWVRFMARIVRTDQEAKYATGILLDIDERVRAQEKLRMQADELEHQRTSLKAIFDSVPCGIMQYSIAESDPAHDKLISFNDATWQVLGYRSRSRYVEHTRAHGKLGDIHPDDREKLAQLIASVRGGESGASAEIDHRIITPNGAVKWLQAIIQRVSYADADDVLQLVFIDITENKKSDSENLGDAIITIYNEVFEVDLETDTSVMRASRDGGKNLQVGRVWPFVASTRSYCMEHVYPDDLERVMAFFDPAAIRAAACPVTLEYRVVDEEGTIGHMLTLLLRLRGSQYLICSQSIADDQSLRDLARENERLRELIANQHKDGERSRCSAQSTGVVMCDHDASADTCQSPIPPALPGSGNPCASVSEDAHVPDDGRISERAAEDLDASPSFSYIIDPDTYELLFCNKMIRDTTGTVAPGTLCHQLFMNRSTACTSCPVTEMKKCGVPIPIIVERNENRYVMQAARIAWQGRGAVLVDGTSALTFAESPWKRREEEMRRDMGRYIHTLQSLYDEIVEMDFGAERLKVLYSNYAILSSTDAAATASADAAATVSTGTGEPHAAIWPIAVARPAAVKPATDDAIQPSATGGYLPLRASIAHHMTCVVEEDRPAFAAFCNVENMRGAFHKGRAPSLVYRIIGVDGKEYTCESTLLQIDYGRYLCCSIDITKQVDAERLQKETDALRAEAEAQECYRVVVENTDTAVVDYNMQTGTIVSTDSYARYAMSYQDQALVFQNRGDRTLVHSDDQEALEEFFANTNTSEPHISTVLRLKMSDGSFRWTRLGRDIVFDDRGEPRRTIATFADVDEETRTRREYQAISERFDLIVKNIPVGIAIYELRDAIYPIYVSDRTCTMFGFTREEYDLRIANGQPVNFMPDMKNLPGEMQSAPKDGEVLTIEHIHAQRKDGSWFDLQANVHNVGQPGQPMHAYVTLIDISEQVADESRIVSQEQELAAITSSIPGGIFKYSADTDEFSFVSENMLSMLGYTHDEFVEKFDNRFSEMVYEPDRAKTDEKIWSDIAKTGDEDSCEYRIETKSGALKWVHDVGHLVTDAEGDRWFIVVIVDIDERKDLEIDLAARNKQINDMIEAIPGGIAVFNCADGRIVRSYITEAALQILGYASDEAPSSEYDTFVERVHPDDRPALTTAVTMALANADRFSHDMRIVMRNGEVRWINLTANPVKDAGSGALNYYGMFTDVTIRRSAEERAITEAEVALIDGVTGVGNRVVTERDIRAKLGDPANNNCALLIADLDDLKNINDTYGHIQGDNALRAVADTLKEHFRKGDVVGRIGGDEFMVLMPNVRDAYSLHPVFSALLKKLGEQHIGDLSTNCSIGCAMGVAGITTFEELYEKADRALYHVKRNGKDDYAFYASNLADGQRQ